MVRKPLNDFINNLPGGGNGDFSVDEFVEIVSNIYHGFEASVYDVSQISINESQRSWQKALNSIEVKKPVRLLDYGAGTGFATLQVLQSSIGSMVKEVVCYDLSQDMIAVCEKKLKSHTTSSFTFLSGTEGRERLLQERPFDLVVTNALLHHLLDVDKFLSKVGQWVAPSGYYIAGHEPNCSFYYNTKLVNITKKFQKYKRIRQRLTMKYWLHKTGIKKSFPDLIALTNNELIRQNLITVPIPRHYLHKLVDVHVPFGISTDQPWGEIGFKNTQLQGWLGSDFESKGLFTYSHIKDGLAHKDWFWRKRLKQLQWDYPNDGADALMIFKRNG